MSKQEFFVELRKGLSGLPKEDIEERISFYNEMIDDRIEEGLTEDEAIKEIGSVDMVVEQILAETPLTKIVKEKVNPNRGLKTWEIVLLVLGSPLWLSLLLAVISVLFSVYLVVWSMALVLWSVEIGFAGGFLCAMLYSVVIMVQGNGIIGLGIFGAGLSLLGLSILLYFGCIKATKKIVELTKKIALGIKKMVVGKERL